jgi:hypothetical protein
MASTVTSQERFIAAKLGIQHAAEGFTVESTHVCSEVCACAFLDKQRREFCTGLQHLAHLPPRLPSMVGGGQRSNRCSTHAMCATINTLPLKSKREKKAKEMITKNGKQAQVP